jgi:hypothetical protein
MRVAVGSSNARADRFPFGVRELRYPQCAVAKGTLQWISESGYSPSSYACEFFSNELAKGNKLTRIVPMAMPKKVYPVMDSVSRAWMKSGEQSSIVYYDLVWQGERLELWMQYGSKLSSWKYNPEKGWKQGQESYTEKTMPYWDKTGEYEFDNNSLFEAVPAEKPLIVTAKGNIYRLADNKASLVSKIDLPGDGKSAESGQTDKIPPRLVLLDTGKGGKYVVFLWEKGSLKPLDVRDSDKKNLEPFIASGDAGKELADAAKSLMTELTRDELKIVECGKRLRASAEKGDKQPRKKTLKQILEN